ncbi:MAG: hypothetical protein GF401_18750 [Chitinivibrionales bacterium]|nr:hypothetical protein [Chitinivibrionales bacterium]
MTEILVRIKRAILLGNFRFSRKAWDEMKIDHITELDVLESISNAVAIYKRIRSTSVFKKSIKEYLYIIQSPNMHGLPIYTKGKLVKEQGQDVFYFIISSKKSS